MSISVISYSFHQLMRANKMDIFGYLESVKYRYGLQAADIWNGMLASTEDDYLAAVKDGLAERGLALANLAVDGAHTWEDDPATRELHYQRALEALKAGEALGAQTVRIDAGSRADAWTPQEFDWIVKRYKEYAQRAYDGGYKIGPENHWGPEKVPAYLKALCQAVDSPAFGVLLHFERWSGDEAAAGDGIIAPWVMHTHVNRMIMDRLEAKMAALRDAGYGGCWSVEHAAPNYTEVGVMLARVREVLERWRTAG
ncbi:MAG: TIM barrel protein [Chloroflexota bacterium]